VKLQDKASTLDNGLLHSAEIRPIPPQFSEGSLSLGYFFVVLGVFLILGIP